MVYILHHGLKDILFSEPSPQSFYESIRVQMNCISYLMCNDSKCFNQLIQRQKIGSSESSLRGRDNSIGVSHHATKRKRINKSKIQLLTLRNLPFGWGNDMGKQELMR